MGNRHGAALHPAGSRRRADCRRARAHGAKHLHLRAPCAPWRGPSPLPRRRAGIRTGRGPKPPASARPAPGGRFSPAGSGAGLCVSWTDRSTGHRPARAGKRGSRFLFPRAPTTALTPLQWQGPSPLPQRCAGIRTGRGPKPPASARPATGGRFAPAGSGAGLCVSRTDRSTGHCRAGAGETRCVSWSRPDGRQHLHRFNGRGHRPCHSTTLASGPAGGPKPPASARPATGGRFPPAGSGAGLCPSRTCRSTGGRPARAGETRVAFPDPARKGDNTFTASMAGAIVPATAPRWHQDRPGAQSPRPAPAPPPAGASPPPGRALASVPPGPAGLRGAVPRGRGKRDAFPLPARTDDSTLTASMAGAITPATAPRWHQDRPGAKAPGQRPPRPRRALCTCRVGRWPLSLPDLRVYRARSRRGGGNAGRVCGSRPEVHALCPERNAHPARQAARLPFQYPVSLRREAGPPRLSVRVPLRPWPRVRPDRGRPTDRQADSWRSAPRATVRRSSPPAPRRRPDHRSGR